MKIILIALLITSCNTATADDTQFFINAVTSCEPIELEHGTYTVSQSMPEVDCRIVLNGIGRPTIKLIGDIQFLTIKNRRSSVTNIELVGISTGYNVADGILVKDASQARIENVNFTRLGTALEFDYAHDFLGLNGLSFDKNNLDFLIDKRSSSSFTFINSRFTHSLQAIRITQPVANIAFISSHFASKGTESMIYIKSAVRGGQFSGVRFENYCTIPCNSLEIIGHSYPAHPAQSILIQGNYFTGNGVKSHIVVDIADNISIIDNHILTNPTDYDIEYLSAYPRSPELPYIERNHTDNSLNRELLLN